MTPRRAFINEAATWLQNNIRQYYLSEGPFELNSGMKPVLWSLREKDENSRGIWFQQFGEGCAWSPLVRRYAAEASDKQFYRAINQIMKQVEDSLKGREVQS